MKNYLTIVGFIILLCASFIITNKTTNIMVNNDELMNTIKEVASEYNKEYIDGKVDGNTFIPGISGLEVNNKKSYEAMKKYGVFIGSLLKYNEIKPKNKLKDNYNKYIIGGNKNKKMVSLILLVYKEDDINKILNILEKENVRVNFFIDGYWFEENNELISKLSNNGNVIGNLSYNGNYNDGAYIWMDSIIKKAGKQKYGYCYLEEENKEVLDICAMNKNYTIIPNLVLKNNYLSNIKKNITNGMIISLDTNNILIEELPAIINYIKSKGYEIENLNELLNESSNL